MNGRIQRGAKIRFVTKSYGFTRVSDGRECFFHRNQYCGTLNEEAFRDRFEHLTANPSGQEIFLIVGPGRKSGAWAALAWGFADILGDNAALIKWRIGEERRSQADLVLLAC